MANSNLPTDKDIQLSVVMPCLNEAGTVDTCVHKAFGFFQEHNVNGEVIVADNGSTDDSANIAHRARAIVVTETARGYGSAIMAGVAKANGKYIVIGDADDTYDFSNLAQFVKLLDEGNDLVIGNRFKGGIHKNAMPFLHRYLGNPILSAIGRVFFKTSINDFHCGLRAIRKDSYQKLELRTTGMEFASEMIVKAALSKMKIAETPVELFSDKRNGRSHLNTWQDGWRHLRFLLLYSPRWLFLIPGIFLLILGIIGTVLLMSGPVEVGNKRLDVHTLVYTSGCILIGFQFLSFYFFTRLYAAINKLLPGQEKFLPAFYRAFSLEKGIIAGTLAILAGVFLMVRSFLYWRATHFGNIDPVVVLRWVIPSLVLIVLGLQVIMSFFYLSFLTIKSRQ